MMNRRFAVSLVFLALSSACVAQAPTAPVADHGVSVGGKPLASPAAMAETTIGEAKITVKYNSPSARGRVIMGGLVPYDQVWRTGANPATSFVTTGELKIGELVVPAGSYTLYSLPEEGGPKGVGKPWLLIVNKQTGQWGTKYDQAQDLGRVPMREAKVETPQEAMTISFEKTEGKTTQLHVRWESADVWVKVVAK